MVWPFPGYFPDSYFYLTSALNLALGRGYVGSDFTPVVIRGPVIPMIMAVSFKIQNVLTAYQGILGLILFNALLLVILAFLIDKILGRWVGILTVGIAVCIPYLQDYIFMRVMTDAPQALALLVFILVILYAIKKQSWYLWLSAGFILGIALLMKESAVLWLLFPINLWLIGASQVKRKTY